jgi:RNA polymerase sigma-70 factor, ECF subfamily
MRTDPASDRGRLDRDDAELVTRARRGDHAAFHQLVERHAQAMFALAWSLVGNRMDAEDLVQEAFSGAFRGLSGFRGQSSVKTWLSRIVVRQAAGHLKRRKRSIDLLRSRPAAAPESGSPSERSVDARLDVHAAIRALSPEHRGVMVLREIQGLSYDEIAEVLGVPRGTVESRLFRARRAMQELLKEYMGE